MRRAASLLLAVILAALAGACSESTESDPLPWLRVKHTKHKQIGGLGGRADTYDYYVKRFGFVWTKLDEHATGPAIALGPDHAVLNTAQGMKILGRGDEHAALACGSQRSAASIVAQAGIVDCVDVVSGPAPAVPNVIRWRRISGAGEALVVERLAVEAPDRVFHRAMISFYDNGHQPYFVTRRAADPARPECALMWTAGGEQRTLAGPEGMTLRQCAEPSEWAKQLRRPLRVA